MKRNMGSVDRLIRVSIAALIAVLVLEKVITGTIAVVLIIIAGMLVVTGFLKFCPLYLPFGINTHHKKRSS